MGFPKTICTCHKLGCYNQYYEDLNNIVQHGIPMSDPAWKTHQLELLKLRRPQPLVDKMFLAQNSENPTQKTPGFSQIEQICCHNDERNLLLDTKKYENKTFKLIDSHAFKFLVQVWGLYLKNGISRDSIKKFLLSEREKITSLGEKFNFDGVSIAKEIPLSIETIFAQLGISMDFEEKIFCPEVFSLYDLTATGHINKHFTSEFIQPFPSSIIKLGPLARKECGSLLFKTDDKNDFPLQKPICTFTYQSFQKWSASHMWIPGFEKLLNAHNTHNSQTDPKVISDIWLSKIWKKSTSSPHSKQAFTNRPGNLARIQPPTSQRHKGSSEVSRTKSDQTSSFRYSRRSQTTTSTIINLLPFTHGSDSLVPSDLSSDDNKYLSPMGDETPRFKKDKLEVLQKFINQTKVPSWFSCLPRKFGFKNFQTLKAEK
ncbi:hypothetical protein O181_000615 [Austropuccinia psidii MF-1]|uniref:Uncharacterized protein n=1 Tax=Austropuccinia psidii MF-1 TaxID=1389203 RepID=A0A9Q3GB20_9BASI|nr:hypothetical protein [Austropuccinia psidii MF-1]